MGGEPEGGWDSGERSDGMGNARARLIDAFIRIGAERGYECLSPSAVAKAALLPEHVFFEHFADLRQCLSAAYDSFVERLMREARNAAGEGEGWPDQVRSAVAAGLSSVDETASRSRFFAVDALAAGPITLGRHLTSMTGMVEIMREGRKQHPENADLPELLEPLLIGGLASIVAGVLLAEEEARLPAMEREVVELLLTPYLGREEARRIVA
jgi:AcrR family transcriptional regulator